MAWLAVPQMSSHALMSQKCTQLSDTLVKAASLLVFIAEDLFVGRLACIEGDLCLLAVVQTEAAP
jgi:hypothetical protein